MDHQQGSDVFSLSDHLLAERLQFVKEIGYGNWGSVWLCRPKSSSGKVKDMEVAVKLVHRSKTSTTAARVRSLWNEMKIVRSFKNDPHPSIVPFHSFIITPSYALVTMAYLPTLVPVEVSETRAKEWFKSLLSGVHFLHSRGVVHNDIKPANILLSPANVPVLVDFGFAEKYDLGSPKAFHSNLTYGTPEYLSPERARGIPHDTRKSDIWSLGVTFFEILAGRTPFEYEEGEVFENKEDLEKYWHRTMRGKWVGKYSISQSAERFLKRMIVPNPELRCTATEVMGDAYWDVAPVIPAHRKSASAAVPATPPRAPSVFDSFKHAFREKEREISQSRLFDISLPWSPSRSASRCSTSRPASRMDSVSRPASRMGVSRTESTPRLVSGTPSVSKSRATDSPSAAPATPINRPIVAQPSSLLVSPAVRARTHSRSKSQPKLRAPPGISTVARTRKLSTVQASPIVKPQLQIGVELKNEASDSKVGAKANSQGEKTLVSLCSTSSMRRPRGPRQPSPRVASIAGVTKEPVVPLGRLGITLEKHVPFHPANLQTPDRTRTRAPLTPKNNLQTPAPTVANQASQQTSISKQLSGKPPRTRGRAGMLADLTGFARNVDLAAHGVGRPTKPVGEKRDKGKENTKTRTLAQRHNKENNGPRPQVHSPRKDARTSNGVSGTTPLSPKTPVTEKDTSTSIPLAINLSSTTTVARGSVRDRMMDWERERARLREMDRLAEADRDHASTILTGTTTDSDSSDDDDSAVEAEVAAEVASAQAKIPVEPKEGNVSVEAERPGTPRTTASSTPSHMERSQIEVARIAVRASAQILSSRNGSISALALNQSAGRQPSESSPVKNDSVTDIGLPVETRRHGESGFASLKHSVKTSIDKGMRFYKSSTLGQLTGRTRCASPEPIDFDQRRSGEEGRFSWENIRHEHEVALDRMNMWIQSVEKVVEETRQNFASTTVMPPAALPLSPVSRSSSQFHGSMSAQTLVANNGTLNTGRSSRPPRRHLAANEIFAEFTNSDAPFAPASSRENDPSNSSCIHAPLPSTSALTQTPRRRRATISTRTPTQERNGSTTSGVYNSSPSKQKSKSQSNLDRHIQDITKLELELDRAPVSSPSPKLSAVLDRSLFVAPPLSPRFTEGSSTATSTTRGRSICFDDLNSPPYVVEPYPARKSGEKAALGYPDRQHLEGVYDRFLMATSGVKRVGKGYQSDHLKLVDNSASTPEPGKAGHAPRSFAVFGTNKRPMPPPVSCNEAWRRSSVDEFGFITAGQDTSPNSSRSSKDDPKRTFVRRAIKAMVPGRTVPRKLSRPIVV